MPVAPLFYERVGSGETEGAPELRQALEDGRRGAYEVLLVLHTSRFARNRREAANMKAEFRKAGIVIYFVAQRLISGTYHGGLAEGISEVIDEQENETRRMWIAGGHRQRQLAGRWLGLLPYGYRKKLVNRDDGTRGWDGELELDPVRAPVAREIFERAAGGEGTSTIVTALNAAGHRTTRGGVWRDGAVIAILRNPAYVGDLVRYRSQRADHYYDHDSDEGAVTLKDAVPAIVSRELFEDVRRIRATRKPPGGQARIYPLSSVMRCRRCGGRMTGVMGTDRRYYRCHNRAVDRSCDAPSIRADDAELAFAEWVAGFDLRSDWRTEFARTRALAPVREGRDQRRTLEQRLERIRDLYSWNDISKEEYLRQSAAIKADLGVIALPAMGSIEAAAQALEAVGPGWLTMPPALQAKLPPVMLKAIEVDRGRIASFVVDAGIKPLLDLCVPSAVSLSTAVPQYTVRYSA